MMDAKVRAERLIEVLRKGTGRLHLVLTQMDPDGCAGIVGLEALLSFLGVETIIYYCGVIGHPQNRCIFNTYDLGRFMHPISELQFGDGQGDRRFGFVDSSDLTDSRLGAFRGRIKPVLIIDHHDSKLEQSADDFIWIDQVGAASTLVVELMRAFDFDLASEERRYLAAILAMGIYTDTKALVSANYRDREAYGWVTNFVPPEEISNLIDYDLPEDHFVHYHFALDHMDRRGATLVASCGFLKMEEGDILSTIADEFLRMEGVNLVLVWGIVNSKLRVSARSRNPAMQLKEYLCERFGKDAGAKHPAKRRSEGGALITIDAGPLVIAGTEDKVLDLATRFMELKVFGS